MSTDADLTDQSPMPFGKHQGEKLENVPAKYLLWLWDNGVHRERTRPLHRYILANFRTLETEASDYIVSHFPEGYVSRSQP